MNHDGQQDQPAAAAPPRGTACAGSAGSAGWAGRAGVALLALAGAGCTAIQPVQPWEKGVLARPEMTFEGDRLDNNFVEHTYSSKEAASGGAGVGGGGCGCN